MNFRYIKYTKFYKRLVLATASGAVVGSSYGIYDGIKESKYRKYDVQKKIFYTATSCCRYSLLGALCGAASPVLVEELYNINKKD